MGKHHHLTASLAAASITLAVFAPTVTAASPSPSPSPSLDSFLIAPNGSYVEEPAGQYDGPMTAADYAGTDSQSLAELRGDEFVQGYIRSWYDPGSKHLIQEMVIAFGGHRNAAKWLTSLRNAANTQYLVHAISAQGVDSYFGGHYADPTQPIYSDLGIFLKGNDFFSVGATSRTDDLGDVASSQARRQFDAAPSYSIAPNKWPENTHQLTGPINFGAATRPLAIGGGAAVIVLVLAVVTLILLISRRPRPVVVAAATVDGDPQMSPDGRYWWDGQAWRDAEKAAPPAAMRSPDGYYWWDSRTWRPVPPTSSS